MTLIPEEQKAGSKKANQENKPVEAIIRRICHVASDTKNLWSRRHIQTCIRRTHDDEFSVIIAVKPN
jgi:hypothetical protein